MANTRMVIPNNVGGISNNLLMKYSCIEVPSVAKQFDQIQPKRIDKF